MAVFTSYDMKGEKLSFANWISNLSPVDTFFVSTTPKEQVQNTTFSWQTDLLAAADKDNAQRESDDVVAGTRKFTETESNYTQILRKAVEVTDTADALDNYGRTKELAYQMEKAGKEILRDLELILLQDDQDKNIGSANSNTSGSTGTPRKTASFGKLVGKGTNGDTAQADTGAVVVQNDVELNEVNLFKATYNLYLAGARANVIMFHPENATFFSSLMEVGVGRTKMIDNLETKLNKFVGTLVDPLGQEYKLVPNRFMPKKRIYIFNPLDWTQMVLRAPEKVKLAKTGSSEKHMIEMEVGLRHVNPYASAIIKIA